MTKLRENDASRRDWKISATLLAVWCFALFITSGRNDEIPFSMLAIATVFFVLLIPAMNDIVRSIEANFTGHFDGGRENRDPTEG